MPADPLDTGATVRLRWSLALEPRAAGELRWTVWADTAPTPPDAAAEPDAATLFPEPPLVSGDEGAAAYRAWDHGTTTVDSDHEIFDRVMERSVHDLRLLVNDGPGPDQRYIAAGVPWFATLFGRDSIIASLQSLAFRPQVAVETLSVLAAYQATAVDDRRDAEPGKILHELRTGEMAGAGELPHTPYYGSVDSTPLWLILLGETFDWTGDRALLDRLWPNALAALEWIDTYGDRDGDGFVEYERRSERGLLNQGWKDSSDAIRDRDGRGIRAADRAGRGPGLRLRRQAPDGRPGPRPRRRRAGRRGSMPTRRRCASASKPRSGSRTSATTRSRSTATSARPTRSARTPASACGRGS